MMQATSRGMKYSHHRRRGPPQAAAVGVPSSCLARDDFEGFSFNARKGFRLVSGRFASVVKYSH